MTLHLLMRRMTLDLILLRRHIEDLGGGEYENSNPKNDGCGTHKLLKVESVRAIRVLWTRTQIFEMIV